MVCAKSIVVIMLEKINVFFTRSAAILLLVLLGYTLSTGAFADNNNQGSASAQDLRIALLAAEARFDTNTMRLTPAGMLALQNLLKQLNEYHEILAIRIIGHTDDVGSSELNKSLSVDRANYIRRSFVKDYSDSHLIAIGMGETQPIASNQTAAGRERNRRVEIQIVARGYMSGVADRSVTNN